MQNKIKYTLLLVALTNSLHAQNQYTLDTISVSASQDTVLNKKSVTDSVKIITKEALKESRITNLAEALNKLGGISMTQNGVVGSTTSVFTRGMDSRRTLVLIDGIRYNSPASTGIDYGHFMLHNVEQIEIIKGTQSGVWGGDASAGVINIVTSKAKKGTHTTANVEYGSFNTITTSAVVSHATDKYDVLIGASYLNADGFSSAEPKKGDVNYAKRYDELGLEKDSYNNKSFNAKLGYNISDKDRIQLNIQTIDSLLDFDGGAGLDSNIPQTDLKNRLYGIVYTHKGSTHKIQTQLNVSEFEQNGKTSYGAYLLKGSVKEAKVADKIKYSENDFVKFGGSYQKYEQIDVTPNTNKSFTALSGFITNYNKPSLFTDKKTIITESIRYDEYNEFENSLSGKLGIKQFLNKDLYLSTNIGTGFNTPTLGQLFGQWGANPNLKPEKTLSSDFTIGNDKVYLTGFYNEVDDLIEYTTAYVQSSGTSKFKGIEIGYEDFFFETIGLNTSYTYLEAKNANNQVLQRRPKHQLDVNSVYYMSNSLDLGVNAQYIGTRYNNVDKTGAQTGKYVVTNLVLNVKSNKNLAFYAKINNITDEYYQSVDGYATAERSFYLGLNAKY